MGGRPYRAAAAIVRQSNLFGVLTLLGAFISLLGILGLSSFTVLQRTKEIGIRKALGAEPFQLVFLLAKDIIGSVLLAGLLAVPMAYLLMKRWLEDFAYQTTITPLVFLFSVGGAWALATLTVGSQAMRAAKTNPVNVLRKE